MSIGDFFSPQFWSDFWAQFTTIIFDGGWLMIPLALLSLGIYWAAFSLFAYFWQHNFFRVKRPELEAGLEDRTKLKSELRSIVEYVECADARTRDDVRNRFVEIHNAYVAQLESRVSFMMVMVTSAPLMGLLGTVMGMLTTFGGIAMGGGGNTVDQIAAGISEALITTQTGLIIAIPGYVMISMITKRRDQLENFLTSLEATIIQRFDKRAKLAAA